MVAETVGTVRDGIRVMELSAHFHQSFGSIAPIPVTEFAAEQRPPVAVRFAVEAPCSLEVPGRDDEVAVVRSPTIADTERHSCADSFYLFI